MEVCAYEACRVFRDRLVAKEDRNAFDNILASAIRASWAVNVPPPKEGANKI